MGLKYYITALKWSESFAVEALHVSLPGAANGMHVKKPHGLLYGRLRCFSFCSCNGQVIPKTFYLHNTGVVLLVDSFLMRGFV